MGRLRLALSSPRGPFRNYRRKSTDLKMSWSTKRGNSRPSLTNSTRPSPRCPATKSLLSILYKSISQNFFLRKKHKMFSRFVCHQNLEFCSTTFLYDFSPSHKLFPSYLKKKRNHSLQSR